MVYWTYNESDASEYSATQNGLMDKNRNICNLFHRRHEENDRKWEFCGRFVVLGGGGVGWECVVQKNERG